ncbi:CcmD family protein [Catalinimonas sp. 4WD22]|uniref:CcmD family protein n=1 Tax=Catalinimonas locisalis TaxID=3133978 RepID=UPI0031014ECB
MYCFFTFIFSLFSPINLFAQANTIDTENWITSPGVIGTLVLVVIVIIVGILILLTRLNSFISRQKNKHQQFEKSQMQDQLANLNQDEIDIILEKRKKALKYQLKGDELGSNDKVADEKGLIYKVTHKPDNPIVDEKKQASEAIDTPSQLKKLIIYYLGSAVFWLVFGTLVGQYLGMKFIWPELDNMSWLSFGRLRPVHTNTVFWGWTSLSMFGLGYFVVSRTSNVKIYNHTVGWYALAFINLAVVIGNICLMAGINNGGGEYREYVWPVMSLFALGLVINFWNFYKTVATRKISEIYISNWYILGAMVWTIVLVIIGYLPVYQNGLGETVIQGYYMHQGVGMWFMTFTLGLIYYYLPSALNKPIYSYSLGVLAFWTQMLFYTMIGTHHFVFSPLPWWLQTIAIVFSAGMFIPVIAGTTNFLMTMRGSWNHISKSYVLPFFLIGVIFYFVGSAQGSFQAFRFTNYIWHFTDFNVAHSHMTMYGIIAFILWACIYAILPRLTAKEPPQLLVGAHFWLALIGLLAYMISLMAGGTLKGLSWVENAPFIESVIMMRQYWVWRAIGGTLMFISHLLFAYNFYYMVSKGKGIKPIVTTKKEANQAETKAYV